MILQGKSLEILQTIDSESIDCVITDPPYAGFQIPKGPKKYCDWFLPHYQELYRISRQNKRIAISQPKVRGEAFREVFPFQEAAQIRNAYNDDRNDDAFFFLHNPVHKPSLVDRTIQKTNWPKDIVPVSIHPNDRDINKMAWLVQIMSNEGDLILDPFCGSGAIGVACILLNRRYLGIELMSKRAADANRRIEVAKKIIKNQKIIDR